MNIELQEEVATAPAAAAAVETEGLTKTYGSLHAVDDMSLVVPAGSIFGLIGPNGAGKTTTFQILATLLKPTSGRASVFGIDPVKEPYEVRKLLGYMPDSFGLYDDIRVGEYLEFFASAYRLPAASRTQIVTDLLELVDLTHKSDAFVESLSRGMKQRLGLARALVHDPKVLILDEPASGLDPRARGELRELVFELQRMGKTLLISSHILPELQEMCTHIGIIEAGHLLASGEPDDIVEGIGKTRPYELRLLSAGDEGRALELLQSLESVVTAACAESVCTLMVSGGEESAADVLAEVVRAGIRVAGFGETHADLEDIFMKITKGVVQ